MDRRKYFSFAILSIILVLAGLALAMEVLLRFLPVNEGLHTLSVDEHFPVLRFEPNRISQWSRFWNFSMRNRVRTNNYGFVSNQDYEINTDLPLLAMIGDSYIEATMVPWADTAAARLQEYLAKAGRVYTFAASGSALSQYLVYADYVRTLFGPRGLVILVVGNDFDESLLKYKQDPGYHYFVEETDGSLRLHRVDLHISTRRQWVRSSRLAMYLITNLNLSQALYNIWSATRQDEFVGNTQANRDPQRMRDSERVVDTFLSMLPIKAGLSPSKVLLVVDGLRPQLYDPDLLAAAEESYFGLMRRYLMTEARQLGFQVVDMQPIFVEHYQQWGSRFEFPRDAHWNGLGHELFARAVLQSDLISYLLQER